MTLAERMRWLLQRDFVTSDGATYRLEPAPAMSDAEIEALGARFERPVPPEVRDLLALCRGFLNGPLESLDFSGLDGIGMEEVFPHALDFAHDGCGNFWIVDLEDPAAENWGPIYFLCHDPPVVAYQSPDLGAFLEELGRMDTPGERSEIERVRDDSVMQIWVDNPGVLEAEQALKSLDPEIRAFAEEVGDRFLLCDLRKATPGDGFSWGRFGPTTPLRRRGHLPLFAYGKKLGLVARLLGG